MQRTFLRAFWLIGIICLIMATNVDRTQATTCYPDVYRLVGDYEIVAAGKIDPGNQGIWYCPFGADIGAVVRAEAKPCNWHRSCNVLEFRVIKEVPGSLNTVEKSIERPIIKIHTNQPTWPDDKYDGFYFYDYEAYFVDSDGNETGEAFGGSFQEKGNALRFVTRYTKAIPGGGSRFFTDLVVELKRIN